jgi:hypothetical protein
MLHLTVALATTPSPSSVFVVSISISSDKLLNTELNILVYPAPTSLSNLLTPSSSQTPIFQHSHIAVTETFSAVFGGGIWCISHEGVRMVAGGEVVRVPVRRVVRVPVRRFVPVRRVVSGRRVESGKSWVCGG